MEQQLLLTRIERDMYKEMLHERQWEQTVYAAIYSVDNGEGANTDTCIGVFSKKSLAYKAIYDSCIENNFVTFTIDDFNTNTKIKPGDSINVIAKDTYAHGADSTSILGVSLDLLVDGCYTIPYVVT